jgi:hypothetical protein
MTPLESYLTALREIRSSGEAVVETSFYSAFATLFDEIGKTLKPRVRCVLQLKNRGAGNPDGGLFTDDQLKKRSANDPALPQMPARGVIEIKPTSNDAWLTADGEQVSRYWGKYRQVLVTNYRDFVFVGQDAAGNPVKLETYRLADSEADFWSAAAHPKKTAALHEATFVEFAKRAMLHAAPLSAPEDLAWFLASYAREALYRIGQHDLPALATVRKALEEALGLAFEGEKGEHFFRSTLVQTLFYGVFSAWVLWSKQRPPGVAPAFRLASSVDRFDWTQTARLLRVPILRKLFYEVAEPGQLENLNLSEILDRTSGVLNRVDRASFFAKFQEVHAVQYFYEPFLQAFDPDLRKQLGVWYTPPEIVQYMVARVDTVLREELNLPDGLADKNVYVLDPCCGTGSYLVEVLHHIHRTLKARGGDALIAADLKEAARNRVFGFEILPAPFVVAHLQLGLLLQNLGAPLAEKGNERVGVFLTNALTGWEPPKEPKKRLLFPELEEERDAAEHVKRDTPILVILGNPPYNAFAGVSPEEEQGLVEPYKEGLVKEWKIKKFNLDDLYIRFFRLAERRITENPKPGRGILCFISNFSYLSDPSFVVMRQRFLREFDSIWFDCMNGDSRETGKLTPEGKPDPSVFSTQYNREGIRVGTAIGLLVRKSSSPRPPRAKVHFRQFWGAQKREKLLRTLDDVQPENEYRTALPDANNRLSFRPSEVTPQYLLWPKLTDLCATPPLNGLMEKRAGALIDMDHIALEKRIRAYYDPQIDWDSLRAVDARLTTNAARFDARKARQKIQSKESYDQEHLIRYALRPFDNRWCYFSPVRPLWNEPRPELWRQRGKRNTFLMTRPAGVASPEGVPFFLASTLGDNDFLRGHAYYIPVQINKAQQKKRKNNMVQRSFLDEPAQESQATTPNLSKNTHTYISKLRSLPASAEHGDILWSHVLAIGFAPRYLSENPDGIRQDWPRIPLPNSGKDLQASAELGRQIATLLDTESPVKGVTTGNLRPELRPVAVATRVGGGSLKNTELSLTAGWGHAGKGGITMPGKGKLLERDYSPAERKAILEGARSLGLSEKVALQHLGETTYDVHLNDVALWANIPSKVWDYTIGGYQVIKKWLSYREQPLLGRALTIDEVRYVQEMARRIAAILLLQPALDANYESIKQHTFPWPPQS